MSASLVDWQDEHSLDHRRRLRNAMLVSLTLHGSIFAAFAIAPVQPFAPMPEFIAIELLASLPAAPASSRSKAAPTPARPVAPEPSTPEPAPPAPPTPPVVKAPVQVLPEESPGRIRKAKPEAPKPKVVAKLQPEPKPAPRRPKREKALSYEAAMAALDDELGVDETRDLLRPTPGPIEPDDSAGQPEASGAGRVGASVSPELAAWALATRRLIQSKWVTPPAFRNRGLATILEFRLSAAGEVIGTPKVVRSSGDPFFDDNAVRALLTAAPLPPPPEPGRQSFIFNAEAN